MFTGIGLPRFVGRRLAPLFGSGGKTASQRGDVMLRGGGEGQFC